ncbi:MAG: thioredoxin family protein [Pseudomonadota bacterium]
MKRRILLAAAAALCVGQTAWAEILDYSEGLVRDRLDAGETVFVDFSASWCGTCRAQARAIDALRAENGQYDQAVTFIKVDWDTWKSGTLATDLAIPRRSTLVVLQGDRELGRLVADTRRGAIKDLLDTAVAATGG